FFCFKLYFVSFYKRMISQPAFNKTFSQGSISFKPYSFDSSKKT
ncbi:uncharacterized protein METZ01_LOCUS261158, partial [marine metagenome]